MKMKDICLIREDLTAVPIKIRVGEVVIGRGPLFECVDKRVSRNHGLLKLSDDGNILLIATHTNPFYYMASGNKEKEVISQGKSITLQCGDKFALLPNSYCYRVTFTDDKKTKSESITKEEKINHSVSANENDKTWCETIDEQEDTETKSHKTIGTKLCRTLEKNEIIEKKTSSLLVRKRVLPSWMLEDNVDKTTPKKTKNIQPKGKKTETIPNAQVKKKQTPEQFVEESNPSGITNEEYELKYTDVADKVQTDKKLHTISDDEQSNPDTSNNNQGTVQKAIQHISDSEQSDNEQLNDEEQQSRSNAESEGNQQQSTSGPSNATEPNSPNVTNQKRQQCKYGAACYRKNPQHREGFCHPGDDDFEDDNDKPECPYGITCYRKNQLHRQHFKHTTTPAKKQARRQTKRKKKDENNYESDEDSYDEEDPFINDASSDDYQPTDSETGSEGISDGEEDYGTRRMLKEAKRFVKKR